MMKNRKGTTAVFLVFILTAMMSLVWAFIYAAREVSMRSYGDGLLQLAGNSVLSEYSRQLKDEYGLFAFYGDNREMENKIKSYVNYSLAFQKSASLTEVKVGLSSGSLGSGEILEQQILEYMKFVIAKKLLKARKPQDNQVQRAEHRVLRNQVVIRSLPSFGLRGESGLVDWVTHLGKGIPELRVALKKNTEKWLINQYILYQFKHAANQTVDRNTFFSNEVEYILEGDYQDEANRKGVKAGIVALRTPLNLGHIYTDRVKRNELITLAELITPGPQALLTQAAFAAIWALAEAENDAALLTGGKKVPLVKDKSTWATDLSSVINNTSSDYIEPKVNKGLTYEGYLTIFLHFQNKGIKLARVADLIQINMKGNYDGNFQIWDYYCAFRSASLINGRLYEYETKY